jgi:hypothetical protein
MSLCRPAVLFYRKDHLLSLPRRYYTYSRRTYGIAAWDPTLGRTMTCQERELNHTSVKKRSTHGTNLLTSGAKSNTSSLSTVRSTTTWFELMQTMWNLTEATTIFRKLRNAPHPPTDPM